MTWTVHDKQLLRAFKRMCGSDALNVEDEPWMNELLLELNQVFAAKTDLEAGKVIEYWHDWNPTDPSRNFRSPTAWARAFRQRVNHAKQAAPPKAKPSP